MEPTICVVVTYFRKGELLRDALLSVSEQLHEGDELIVVDDASGDGIAEGMVAEACQTMRAQHRLIVSRSNRGAAAAKNLAIRASTREVICLLDADDVLPAGALQTVRRTFADFPDADFVFGDYLIEVPGSSELVSCKQVTAPDGWLDVSKHFKDWRVLGSSPFRRRVVDRIGLLNESRPRTDDVDWQSVAMSRGLRFRYVSEIIYVWVRQESGNNSSRSLRDNFRSAVHRTPLIIRSSEHWPAVIRRMALSLLIQSLPTSIATIVRRMRSHLLRSSHRNLDSLDPR